MKKKKWKKPQTLNAVWADCQCSEDEKGNRQVYVDIQGRALTSTQLFRLIGWLTIAAGWKLRQGEE